MTTTTTTTTTTTATTTTTTTTASTTGPNALEPSSPPNVWLKQNVAAGYEHTYCSQVKILWKHKMLGSSQN